MRTTRVARRYARALMMAAESANAVETIAADLEHIKTALVQSRPLRLFVASPIVSEERKRSVFREVFGPSVSETTLSFLHLLIEKQREDTLPEIIEQYLALRDERDGIVNVDVAAAVDLEPHQEQRLAVQLERYTQRKVRLRFSLDPTLRGGLLVKIGDTVLDATVQHQLERLRDRLAHGPLSR